MSRRRSLSRSISAIRDRFRRRRSDGQEDVPRINRSGPINGSAEDQNDAGAVSVTRDETEGDEQADTGSDQDDADRGRSSEWGSVPTLVRPANTPVEPARIASNSVESQSPLVATYAPTYDVHYAEDIPHYLPESPSSLRRAHTWHAATNDERGPRTLRSLHIDGRLTPPNQQVIFDDEQSVKQLPAEASTPGRGRKHHGLHETKSEKDASEEVPEPTASGKPRHVCRQRPCYTPATPENSCRSSISVPVVGDVSSGRLSRRPRGYTDPYVEKHREAIDEHEYPETDEIWTNEIRRKSQQLAHEKGKAMMRDRDVSPIVSEAVEAEPAPQTSIGSAGLLLGSSLVKDSNVIYTAENLPGDLGPSDPRRPRAAKSQPAPQPASAAIENDTTPSVAPQPSSRSSPSSLGLDTHSFNPDGSDPTPYGAPGNRGKGRAYAVNDQGTSPSASSKSEVLDGPPRQPSIAVSPLTARPNGDMIEHVSSPPSYQATQEDACENSRPRDDEPAQVSSDEFGRLRINQPPLYQQRGEDAGQVPRLPPHNDSVAEAGAPDPSSDIEGKEKLDDDHAPASTTDQHVFSLRLPDSLFSESPRMLDTISMRDLYHQQIVKAVNDDREDEKPVERSSQPPVVGDALTLWCEEANDPFIDRRRRDSVLSHWGEPVVEPVIDRRRRDSVLSNWSEPVDDDESVSSTEPHVSASRQPADISVSARPEAATQGTLSRIWGALKDTLDVVGGDDEVVQQPLPVEMGVREVGKCRPGLFATGWGLMTSPSRKTQRGSSNIDPSYSTDEEYQATDLTLGKRMLDLDDAECSTPAGDSPTSDDAATSDIRRDSLVSGDSPGRMIAHQCHDIASGEPTTIGGLHFNGIEDCSHDGDVFVCAASGPGNFDRTPQSLEQAKRKLRKMVLTQSPSSSNAASTKPSTAPGAPPARTISPGSEALKAVSKAEKLQVPPFDLDAAFDPVSDAVKKSRQLIESLSHRASPAQRPMTGPVAPLTLKQLSREQLKRDSVVTPKAKGKATSPLTLARQSGQATPHQLSPTANRRLSSDDLFPDIYKSSVLGSPYRSPTTQERDRDLNDRLALNAKKSAPPGVEVHDFATGSRNVSGLSEPGSLRDVLLEGAQRNAPKGEGIEVHDFAAGERDVEGLSEVDWCRASSSTKSTPSKRSLGIQLKSGGWSIRAPKSSPIVETSSVDAGLVNASMSRLYDVISPVSTTSMRAGHSGQPATMKENAAPLIEAEAMLPAKLRVKRRKRPTTHFVAN
ncbi:hypothetical protein B0A48_04328 [Cryoendolithus antarcticus]|uniref:Uncharacterized protein n=1 Tax=Cryoendolithus antarcticus TaxID=1507870 RepID=A0A1V8TF22_9PEZI|nr:hypothetical protein B0A48_04328 [Cryoendolithus antarcticus]